MRTLLLLMLLISPAVANDDREPEPKRVRTVRVDPCDNPATFQELWRCRIGY